MVMSLAKEERPPVGSKRPLFVGEETYCLLHDLVYVNNLPSYPLFPPGLTTRMNG